MTVFRAEACFYHIEFLVKRIAAAGSDDVGAPSLRGEITDLIYGNMEVFRPDIVGEGIGIIKECFIGERGIGPQVFPAQIRQDIHWLQQNILDRGSIVLLSCDDGDQFPVPALGFQNRAAHQPVFLFHVAKEDVGTVAVEAPQKLIGIVVAHYGDLYLPPLEIF